MPLTAWLGREVWRVAVVATLFAFVIYLLTLAPGITWRNDGADGGDFIAAVATGGVPHPSGYPTYLLLGSLFAHLPFDGIAYRLNLMSAVAAAGAVGLTGLLIGISLRGAGYDEHGVGPVAAGVAAMTFAASSILWSQAVITEVYALHALFVALLVFLALRARVAPLRHAQAFQRRSTGGGNRWLWVLAAGVFGLGLGNHLSLVLLTPLWAALFWSKIAMQEPDGGVRSCVPLQRGHRRVAARVSLSAAMGLAFLAGLAVYALLPLRAAQRPLIDWGGADTWEGFVWLVSGQAYAPLVGNVPIAYLPGRVLAAASLLCRQVAWWGVPVALLGLRSLWARDRALAVGSMLSFLATVAYAVGYNTTDSYVYLIPAAMLALVWTGWGLCDGLLWLRFWSAGLPGSRRRAAHVACGGGLVVLIALPLAANFAVVDASADREAHDYGIAALTEVAQDAVVLADGDRDTFVLWYFRYAEGRRPDVVVINGHLLAYRWYRESLRRWHPTIEIAHDEEDSELAVQWLIQANLPQHPIYATSADWTLTPGYRLVAAGHSVLYRVETQLEEN
jgi:Protein O-mannosyl-transferase TMEM260-like